MLRARALPVAVALLLGAGVVSAQSVHTDHDHLMGFHNVGLVDLTGIEPVTS